MAPSGGDSGGTDEAVPPAMPSIGLPLAPSVHRSDTGRGSDHLGQSLPPAAAILRVMTRHELSLLRLTACGVALSPCGRWLAVGDFTGQVVLFDLHLAGIPSTSSIPGASATANTQANTEPSSKQAATTVPVGAHQASTPTPRCFLVAYRAKMLQAVRSLAWHPNGRVLAVGCMDGTIVLWHAFDGAVGPCVRLQGNVTAMRFQPTAIGTGTGIGTDRGGCGPAGPPKLAAATTSGRIAIVEVDASLDVLSPIHSHGEGLDDDGTTSTPTVKQPQVPPGRVLVSNLAHTRVEAVDGVWAQRRL